MTQQEMIEYIATAVQRQGTQGAIALAPLLSAIVDKIFSDPETGVSPIVVNISEKGTAAGTATTYEITTEQEVINGYIDSVSEEKAKARLFVQDGDVLISFNFLEINGETITGHATASDGIYKLFLSKTAGQSYFLHDEETKGIAAVTEAEIDGYKALFNANYDSTVNRFSVTIGTVSISLSPAQMLLTTEEYNKHCNDGDCTAMWAYSVAEYICCPKWFEGFTAFKLHSAFYKSDKAIFIDLNTDSLNVATLASAFNGCPRLEQITGIMKVTSATPLTDVFKGCETLHSFKISGLSSNIDLSYCKSLTFETIEYLFENSVQPANGTITVTVHADVLNNINNNSTWADVRTLLETKTYINVQGATV